MKIIIVVDERLFFLLVGGGECGFVLVYDIEKICFGIGSYFF